MFGYIGPAIAYYLAASLDVDTLFLLERDSDLIQSTINRLKPFEPSKKIIALQYDIDQLNDFPFNEVDVIAAALPWQTTKSLIRIARQHNIPMVSITRPQYQELAALTVQTSDSAPIILACGLEPGLTEILALYLVEVYEQVDELRIYCGGLPQQTNPEFNYKKVFGHRLPLDKKDAYYINAGQLCIAPRFSGIESIVIPGIGTLEAWHDGMVPWLFEYQKFKNIKYCSQKTLRWPGFANTVNLLSKLGFLSETPIIFQGNTISPREFIETILHPYTHFDPAIDREMTILYLKAIGLNSYGKKMVRTLCLTDRYDENSGLTSMARATGYTLGYVAIQLAQDYKKYRGLIRPEQLLADEAVKGLLITLQQNGMRIEIQQEEVE